MYERRLAKRVRRGIGKWIRACLGNELLHVLLEDGEATHAATRKDTAPAGPQKQSSSSDFCTQFVFLLFLVYSHSSDSDSFKAAVVPSLIELLESIGARLQAGVLERLRVGIQKSAYL